MLELGHRRLDVQTRKKQREPGERTLPDVAQGAAEGDVTCIRLIRDGGRRVGSVLAGLVSFTNPSMIVIGGGLAQLGHILLAEIRSVVYRRSLPLATRNLEIVATKLDTRSGLVGLALLLADDIFAPQRVGTLIGRG